MARTKYYYMFNDMISLTNPGDANKQLRSGIVITNAFKTMWQTMTGQTADTMISDTYINELWCSYLIPRHYWDVIEITDNVELTTEVNNTQYLPFVERVVAVMRRTYPKYKKMLDMYESNKNNLLNTVSTVNTTRYNDTPQNGGDYTSDTYTSDFTKNTSESDYGTLMMRIAEIDNNWRELMTDWADEFNNLFYSLGGVWDDE